MSPPFQVALELTNLLNPLSQVVSILGSLRLVDAIKKSGSDAITEMRLANLIGRHRVDDAIEVRFRHAVARAEQSFILRYIDIVLEAGAGPSVRESLKHPALLSMVIQLSALTFSHEQESLANAIIEAFERITKSSGRDLDAVPDYVSLLGTLRACQEQTAAFDWAPLYEAVEYKIEAGLRKAEEAPNSQSGKRRRKARIALTARPESITDRQLPFPVLHSLLMWLPSLQSLPENRMLHIKTNCGISTIVVWCYHVLKGLSIVVRSQGVDICFGDEGKNIIIEDVCINDVSATLMDPIEHYEPLFTLLCSEEDPALSHEQRLPAFGFGLKLLGRAKVKVEETRRLSHWMVARALTMLAKPSQPPRPGTVALPILYTHMYPSESDIITAGKSTFALEAIDYGLLKECKTRPLKGIPRELRNQWPSLVAIIIVFARIRHDDLEGCKNLPLSLQAFHELETWHHQNDKSHASSEEVPMSLMKSFDFLCRLLLGSSFSERHIKPAVLISAWGWSIFLDPVDASDPTDVSLCSMRVLRGVPSRKGVRRARIVDGPTGILLSSSTPVSLNSSPEIVFYPGVGTAKWGSVLVGYQSDAFAVTQTFDWDFTNIKGNAGTEGKSSTAEVCKTHKMGYRMMFELCAGAGRLCSCDCEEDLTDPRQWLDELGSISERYQCRYPIATTGLDLNDQLPERVFTVHPSQLGSSLPKRVWLFFVTGNPASRWLQLHDMYACSDDLEIIMRDRTTCLRCVMDKSIMNSLVLL